MEQDQTPSGDQHDNSRKHGRSTRSSTTTCNTNESCRSGGQELQLSTPLSPMCSLGLLISDKSPKGRNLLGGQDTSGISGGCDTGKGLPGPAPYWSVTSSYESIPISALPPKKRYLRQLQLAQQSEVSPPAVPVAVPAQVPLAGSNSGASFGQKSKQDNSLGPINWRSTRWWNYRKRSSDDADNAEKKDAANSVEAGNSIAVERNRVQWGYGLAKYEKEKRQISNSLPLYGDNADLGISSESMTTTVDCPAALPATSLGSNVQPGCISTNLAGLLQKKVDQKEEESHKISHDNAFLENTPSCEVGSRSIEEKKEKITEVSAVDCVASELSVEEKEYVAADILARKFDGPPSLVVSLPLTCFGSQVEGVGLPKMDKLVNDNSAKNVSWVEGIRKEYEIEWSDDEIFRFTKAMDKNSFDLKSTSNYIGTRSIRECKIFFSKYQRLFRTGLIHKQNENATVDGEVSNSMSDNGVTHIWSAIDSVPCFMDNAHDQRQSIHDHVDRDEIVVKVSTAQDTPPDVQTKTLENNPQLCVTSIKGNYSSLCGRDFARSPVESKKKELTPIGSGNKVTTEKENPQNSQKNSEKVIHSVESNVIKTNGTELCNKVNSNFNTNLSATASEVDSPHAVVSFDLNSPPVVDSIESETYHTETFIGFSAPPLSATNKLQENAKKGRTRSQLPENSLNHNEFREEGQSVSTMQIGTMNGSSCSQADGIMTHVQRIQHPQTNILDTSKDAAKKPSFIKIFGKIFHEDSSMDANTNSKEYDIVEDLTSNLTTNMTFPNRVSGDIPKNLSNVMSSCSAMRTRNIDLIQNQQAGSLKVISSGMTRDDVASHFCIVNLSKQSCKSSTVEGSRMLNGYPSLSDWTRMMTSFQALGSGGGHNEGGSTRNTMTLGSQDQCKDYHLNFHDAWRWT